MKLYPHLPAPSPSATAPYWGFAGGRVYLALEGGDGGDGGGSGGDGDEGDADEDDKAAGDGDGDDKAAGEKDKGDDKAAGEKDKGAARGDKKVGKDGASAKAKDAADPADKDAGAKDDEDWKAKFSEMERKQSVQDTQLAAARKRARADILSLAEVLPEYHELVPDFDPITDEGRAEYRAWLDKHPRLLADKPGAVEQAGLKAEDIKDKPGAELVDLDDYNRGLEDIDRKFSGRGWLI